MGEDFGMTQEELDILCQQDEEYTQEWRSKLTYEQVKNI